MGLIDDVASVKDEMKNLNKKVDSFLEQADSNKDGKVSGKEGIVWFKHAWETPSGRKLIFNFIKSLVSIISCLFALWRMGYEDPGLTMLFITILLTNLGMLSDASNETDLFNLLYSLVDAMRRIDKLVKKEESE